MITADSISTIQGINDALKSFHSPPLSTPVRLTIGPIRSEIEMSFEDGKINVAPMIDADNLLLALWDSLPEDCESRLQIAQEIVRKHYKPSDN